MRLKVTTSIPALPGESLQTTCSYLLALPLVIHRLSLFRPLAMCPVLRPSLCWMSLQPRFALLAPGNLTSPSRCFCSRPFLSRPVPVGEKHSTCGTLDGPHSHQDHEGRGGRPGSRRQNRGVSPHPISKNQSTRNEMKVLLQNQETTATPNHVRWRRSKVPQLVQTTEGIRSPSEKHQARS